MQRQGRECAAAQLVDSDSTEERAEEGAERPTGGWRYVGGSFRCTAAGFCEHAALYHIRDTRRPVYSN